MSNISSKIESARASVAFAYVSRKSSCFANQRKTVDLSGMPAKATVFRWLSEHDDFRDKYAKATEARADSILEEIVEIADNAIPDAAEVAKARLRVDTRKWALARMNPRKYGDKVTNELVGKDGGAIQIEPSPMRTLFGK